MLNFPLFSMVAVEDGTTDHQHVQPFPGAETEVIEYPMDPYMRIEWHLQKLRLGIMRVVAHRAKEQSVPMTRALQHEVLLEVIADPKLRQLMGLNNPPSW